jgi:hypothetical protein
MRDAKLLERARPFLAHRILRQQHFDQAWRLPPREATLALLDVVEPRRGIAEASGELTLCHPDGTAARADGRARDGGLKPHCALASSLDWMEAF